MFRSVLVANRGEIAVRVLRTAKRLGLEAIAVYSDADEHAAHVDVADRSVNIGPPPAGESYLRIEAIIAAARQSGAEAIHPGYGFLSENAEFAEACAAAGIVFIGPPPGAIRAMGLKDRAKALMAKAGVAVVPGYLGEDQSPDILAREADRIGYPVLIKAVAGGGGKGMRRVDATKDFLGALESAKREAMSSFGDDRVLIEKFVARPRHIEIQVFGDRHGNVVSLFERDCSLQRRHQKVIEEAPAPGMPVAMRVAMGEEAIKAARAVRYEGAGTVEFIADASEGLKPDRFWFMEMNTRLQVEHPVTEAITGLDLVEWQLRVAAGEKLPRKQPELGIEGHAIEVRLYAEDPQNGFLPSPGRLELLRFPAGVRVDSGVREGDVVTGFYDPMIAKVIAHDKSREGAVAKLARALSEVEIAGVRTNNAFLLRILRSPDFVAGKVDTAFIERHHDALIPPKSCPATEVLAAAAAFTAFGGSSETSRDPWGIRDGFRLLARARPEIEFQIDGKRVTVAAEPGQEHCLRVVRLADGDLAVINKGETEQLRLYDPLASAEAAGTTADSIAAPMPGKVTQVLVKPGDRVARGQPLAVLEAMKMEHTLSAPAEEQIASIDVVQGDQVSEGAIIIRFKPEKT